MAEELDPRLLRVGFEVDGRLKWYDQLQISASGTKFANPLQDECTVKISNLDKVTRDYILSETSPFNASRTPKRLIVEAGRVSTGYSRIFLGDITAASPSQPPDIAVTVKALTGNSKKGKIVANSQPATAQLQDVAKQVAGDLGASLRFEATPKQIGNYSFTGGALNQVGKLGEAGDVNAYLDGNVLVVKDGNVPLTGRTRILTAETGLIGIPETTEQGLKVKMLYDSQTTLGTGLIITSKIYPAVDGTYIVYKLAFDLANRDAPFYLTAEAKRLG